MTGISVFNTGLLYFNNLKIIDLLTLNQSFHLMAVQEGAFQNLVLMFLNDINATNKEILKFQTRQLAVLEVIKDNLYAKNMETANAVIEQLYEEYKKMSETNVQTCKDLYNKEIILPNWP